MPPRRHFFEGIKYILCIYVYLYMYMKPLKSSYVLKMKQ